MYGVISHAKRADETKSGVMQSDLTATRPSVTDVTSEEE